MPSVELRPAKAPKACSSFLGSGKIQFLGVQEQAMKASLCHPKQTFFVNSVIDHLAKGLFLASIWHCVSRCIIPRFVEPETNCVL